MHSYLTPQKQKIRLARGTRGHHRFHNREESWKFGEIWSSGCWDMNKLVSKHYHVARGTHGHHGFHNKEVSWNFGEIWSSGCCWDMNILVSKHFYLAMGTCEHHRFHSVVYKEMPWNFGENWSSGCWDMNILVLQNCETMHLMCALTARGTHAAQVSFCGI